MKQIHVKQCTFSFLLKNIMFEIVIFIIQASRKLMDKTFFIIKAQNYNVNF